LAGVGPSHGAGELRERALDYLASHNVITLATHGAGGLWAAAVFYVNRDFRIYFLSSPKSRHSLDLTADPQVAAVIQEDYRDWPEIKGIQLEGAARRIEGRQMEQAMAAYRAKYPLLRDLKDAPISIVEAFNRMAWYELAPTRLYFIDNSQGFGHRDEVSLT
jgi:hypothetical protein